MIDLTDERFEGMACIDGYDEAVIGVASRCGQEDVLAYDRNKILSLLNLPDEEAQEYFDYNIAGAYVGSKTPVFVEII